MSRSFQLLLEIQHLTGILLENRLEFLKTRYVPVLARFVEEAFENDDPRFYGTLSQLQDYLGRDKIQKAFPEDTAKSLFDQIVSFDPTTTKKYAQWLLNTFIKMAWQIEDGYKATEYLTLFSQVQHLMPADKRDINRFKSPRDLYNAILPFKQAQSQRQIDKEEDRRMHEQAEIVYNGPDYKVVVPKTQEASCYFGRNTEWCTAASSSYNAFQSYADRGPLYIILDKRNNKRWQFHFESEQLMDEHDEHIDINSFVRQHPKVVEIFEHIIPHVKVDGYYVVKIAEEPQVPQRYTYYVRTTVLGPELFFIGTRPSAMGKNPIVTGVHPEPDLQRAGTAAKILNALKLKPSSTYRDNLTDLTWDTRQHWGSLVDKQKVELDCGNGFRWIVMGGNHRVLLFDPEWRNRYGFTSSNEAFQNLSPETQHYVLLDKNNDAMNFTVTYPAKNPITGRSGSVLRNLDNIVLLFNHLKVDPELGEGSLEWGIVFDNGQWTTITHKRPVASYEGDWRWIAVRARSQEEFVPYFMYVFLVHGNRVILKGEAAKFKKDRVLRFDWLADPTTNLSPYVTDFLINYGYRFSQDSSIGYKNLSLDDLKLLNQHMHDSDHGYQIEDAIKMKEDHHE